MSRELKIIIISFVIAVALYNYLIYSTVLSSYKVILISIITHIISYNFLDFIKDSIFKN
jgi:hypothetical protein